MIRPATAVKNEVQAAGPCCPNDQLTTEARILGRYLLGRQPTAVLSARYAEADRTVGDRGPNALDRRILAFGLAWPWSLASLDAACALLRPQSLLREKLIRLAAVLEASPEFADEFLPASRGLPSTLLHLGRIAIACAGEFVVGVALLKMLALHARVAETDR
jgi:hypothetical protein